MTVVSLSFCRGPYVYLERGGAMLHAGARIFDDPWQHGFGWWLTIRLRGRYLVFKSDGPANRIGR